LEEKKMQHKKEHLVAAIVFKKRAKTFALSKIKGKGADFGLVFTRLVDVFKNQACGSPQKGGR
jgi:hypothetical protein